MVQAGVTAFPLTTSRVGRPMSSTSASLIRIKGNAFLPHRCLHVPATNRYHMVEIAGTSCHVLWMIALREVVELYPNAYSGDQSDRRYVVSRLTSVTIIYCSDTLLHASEIGTIGFLARRLRRYPLGLPEDDVAFIAEVTEASCRRAGGAALQSSI